jgi:SAM-dependent methyltransferase
VTDSAKFWAGRLRDCGHTGWHDPIIYAYDQQERVEIVRSVVRRLATELDVKSALDFGCGVGDVSKMLLSLGLEVYGYDPFVIPALREERFHHLPKLAEVITEMPPVDLTVSVTVLDHILDQEELDTVLGVIRDKTNGRLIMLEYALSDQVERPAGMHRNDYQAFRTVEEWRMILARHSFSIAAISGVPHPLTFPSPGYRRYRRSFYSRAARLLLRLHVPAKFMLWNLQSYAARMAVPVTIPSVEFQDSPLKLMVCQ